MEQNEKQTKLNEGPYTKFSLDLPPKLLDLGRSC